MNGYRRLNVAFTRSRQEMVLFTSLKPAMLKGARAVQRATGAAVTGDFYLVYARTLGASQPWQGGAKGSTHWHR